MGHRLGLGRGEDQVLGAPGNPLADAFGRRLGFGAGHAEDQDLAVGVGDREGGVAEKRAGIGEDRHLVSLEAPLQRLEARHVAKREGTVGHRLVGALAHQQAAVRTVETPEILPQLLGRHGQPVAVEFDQRFRRLAVEAEMMQRGGPKRRGVGHRRSLSWVAGARGVEIITAAPGATSPSPPG